MNEPQIWWYVTRTSAILAWVLLTISVVWGILLSTRVARRIDNPSWLQDLHRYLAGVGIIMVALHMVSLMLDEYIHMSAADLLIPFASAFKPLPVAIGIIAMYVFAAVYGSSLIRDRIPAPVWKGIHLSSYVAVLLVALHAGWTGTDVTELWYRIVAGVLIGLTAVALIVRVVVGRPGQASKPSRESAPATKPASNAVAAPDTQSAQLGSRTVLVSAREQVAHDIVQFSFRAPGGTALPTWQPGDHISLRLPNGMAKQYSLCGDPADIDVWSIAVKRSTDPNGGSAWIHDNLTVGDQLEAHGPAHKFELVPAHEYVFIAAGIGITPIRAMIQSLPPSRKWRLVYLGTEHDEMAFVDELVERYPEHVEVWESQKRGSRFALEELQMGLRAVVYACGPEGMLDELERLVPAERLHVERFAASDQAPDAEAKPFAVECRKSKKTFEVSATQTMLQALEANSVPVLASCREGICGSCEVRVVSGTPDHRDEVLDEATKDKLHVMYPCVSRSYGDTIVIDA